MARLLLALAAALLSMQCYGQKPVPLDMLNVTIGKPFPIPPLFPFKSDGSQLPFYSYSAPMPSNSQLNMFFDYDVDAMKDNGNVYSLRAKRTFDSTNECTRALKSLTAAVTAKYQLVPSKSEPTLFQAAAKDIEVESSCAFAAGSPYPTLSFRITSTSEKQRVSELMRKAFPR